MLEVRAWFPKQTTHLQTSNITLHKQALPHKHPIIALAFSIHQTGPDGQPKVRRGEDWRRSGQRMPDGPPTLKPPYSQHLDSQSQDSQTVWGHDHDGAYRQLPLQDPEVAYVLLQTPHRPTLWHHHVLLFGSAASVWVYKRFGDMLTHVSRCFCGIPVLHYVDDYGSISQSSDSDSCSTHSQN